MSSTVDAALPLWTHEPASRPDRARIRARIAGMHCSLCTGTIEKALGRHTGVEKVSVSLTHEQALVEYDPRRVQPEDLLRTLRQMGYTISDPRKLEPFEAQERQLVAEGRRFLVATIFSLGSLTLISRPGDFWYAVLEAFVAACLLGFVFLVLRSSGLGRAIAGTAGSLALVVALSWLKATGRLAGLEAWLAAALAVSVVFVLARHILAMAWQSLRRGIINQHVLLEAAAFAGLGGGTYGLAAGGPDFPTAPFFCVAVMVCNYHIFSEWLSLIVKTRSSQAVRRLLALQPETACVMRDGRESEISIEAVRAGDFVRVHPGERVAVDGTVMEGHSAVDQSLVTGEPLPVERTAGDPVIGGSLNGLGTLLVRVSAVGEASFLQRVAREVEDARALKPGMLHLVDRVLKVYAPAVLSLALAALLGWLFLPMLAGAAADLERAVFAGLTVLVMGYPCALGISAPLSIVRGAGEAAERGILMRTGEAFQGFRLATHVVFDKTGTLTEGKFSLREVETAGASEEELLGVAAAAEAASEHPLAKAVMAAALERGMAPPELESFRAAPGRGVRASIESKTVLVGSPRFLSESGVAPDSLGARITALEDAGRTVIVAARAGRLLGLLAFGDRLRDGAREAVAALRRAGVRTLLVSGDNQAAAARIATEAGIDEVHAGLLPHQKAGLIRELQRLGNVAMVGDGINDAPALMQANVGIAMGAGTDIAIDAADIIVLNNRLEAVVTAREVSRWSYRKMVQNVCLAVLFNGIGVPLAATGLVYPIWAMAAMAVSVTLIFFNSLRGRPRIFFDAILSVGRVPAAA
ncbi:MAG: cation-translocating P-type ATPase [Burkholderiales bacterium]|nr:cation-translocating P-type ATPase [Burkholderiales bacterium]